MLSAIVSLLPLLVLQVSALASNASIGTQDSTQLTLTNDRLVASVNKKTGAIYYLKLDGQDLLGDLIYVTPTPGGATGSGNSGIGPYLDCYCIPSGSYTPGSIAPKYELFNGIDSTGTKYGGIVMNETYPATGQTLYMYWFLREGETGLHTFSRLAYYNKTTPFLRNLQEFRTLFRPNTPMWTHLLTNEEQYAPLPSKAAIAKQVVVQDATWYYGATPNDSYVQQEGSYFTKYIFQDTYRDHSVHGMYADGSQTTGNYTFGSWLVQNTKDTYFGGPTYSDLIVDGIVYNYIGEYSCRETDPFINRATVSNHHGDGTPNITDGFDRTFGPVSTFQTFEIKFNT